MSQASRPDSAAPRRSILVVEDEPLLRELLGSALETRGFQVVTAGTPSEARRGFHALDPDAIVMDVDLGPGPDGFALADALLEEETGAAVVFLTNLPDPRFAGREPKDLPRGVAYLHKRAVLEVDRLVETLDAALRGGVDASMRQDRDPKRPFASLTRRQVDVLRLVALGKTNAQIAELRGTTLKAVESAVARAFESIGIGDEEAAGNWRVAAARRFFRWAGEPIPFTEDHARRR